MERTELLRALLRAEGAAEERAGLAQLALLRLRDADTRSRARAEAALIASAAAAERQQATLQSLLSMLLAAALDDAECDGDETLFERDFDVFCARPEELRLGAPLLSEARVSKCVLEALDTRSLAAQLDAALSTPLHALSPTRLRVAVRCAELLTLATLHDAPPPLSPLLGRAGLGAPERLLWRLLELDALQAGPRGLHESAISGLLQSERGARLAWTFARAAAASPSPSLRASARRTRSMAEAAASFLCTAPLENETDAFWVLATHFLSAARLPDLLQWLKADAPRRGLALRLLRNFVFLSSPASASASGVRVASAERALVSALLESDDAGARDLLADFFALPRHALAVRSLLFDQPPGNATSEALRLTLLAHALHTLVRAASALEPPARAAAAADLRDLLVSQRVAPHARPTIVAALRVLVQPAPPTPPPPPPPRGHAAGLARPTTAPGRRRAARPASPAAAQLSIAL